MKRQVNNWEVAQTVLAEIAPGDPADAGPLFPEKHVEIWQLVDRDGARRGGRHRAVDRPARGVSTAHEVQTADVTVVLEMHLNAALCTAIPPPRDVWQRDGLDFRKRQGWIRFRAPPKLCCPRTAARPLL